MLELAVTLHPRSATARIDLAEAAFRAGRRADALAHRDQARKLFAGDETMGEWARSFFLWKVARIDALASAAR